MSGNQRPTKFRLSLWADLSKLEAPELPSLYGIQVFVSGRGWCHCTRGSALVLFKDADEAQAELHRLQASIQEALPHPEDRP